MPAARPIKCTDTWAQTGEIELKISSCQLSSSSSGTSCSVSAKASFSAASKSIVCKLGTIQAYKLWSSQLLLQAQKFSVSCLTLGKGLWLLALSLKQTDTTFSVSRTILRRMCFHKIMQAPPLEIDKLERTNRESSIHNIPEPLSLLLTSPQFLNRSLDSHLFHVGHVIIARLCLQQDPSSALTLELRQVKLSWKSPAASCPLPLLAQAVLSRPRHHSQRPQKASSAN